jgi:hypothetical protein
VLWCGVLQCGGLASGEFVCDVTACGRGPLVVCMGCVCVCVCVGAICVSGGYWVGGIR